MTSLKGEGELYIKLHRASLIRDTEPKGKMNPYVKVKFGEKTQVTPADMKAGKEPKWGYSMNFPRKNETILNLEIWSMNRIFANVLIGVAQIDITKSLTGNNYFGDWVTLMFKGKEAGRISVEVTFLAYQKNPYEIEKFVDVNDEPFSEINPEMISVEQKETDEQNEVDDQKETDEQKETERTETESNVNDISSCRVLVIKKNASPKEKHHSN